MEVGKKEHQDAFNAVKEMIKLEAELVFPD